MLTRSGRYHIMENSLVIDNVMTELTARIRRTSHLSNAYPSRLVKGKRFSSLSAGTPKLPLEPLRTSYKSSDIVTARAYPPVMACRKLVLNVEFRASFTAEFAKM